jgi:hypothetical protein
MTVTFDARTFEEFRRLFNNPAFEIQKYLKIDGKYIDLSQRQNDLLHLIQKDQFVKEVGERGTGMTTVLLIAALIDVVTSMDKVIVFVTKDTTLAKELANKFRSMFLALPEWIRPGLSKDNVREICFQNGCKVLFKAAAPEQLKGYSINRLYVDDPKSVKQEFWNCILPTISCDSSKSKVIQFQSVDH